jgi:hypothetical protein
MYKKGQKFLNEIVGRKYVILEDADGDGKVLVDEMGKGGRKGLYVAPRFLGKLIFSPPEPRSPYACAYIDNVNRLIALRSERVDPVDPDDRAIRDLVLNFSKDKHFSLCFTCSPTDLPSAEADYMLYTGESLPEDVCQRCNDGDPDKTGINRDVICSRSSVEGITLNGIKWEPFHGSSVVVIAHGDRQGFWRALLKIGFRKGGHDAQNWKAILGH